MRPPRMRGMGQPTDAINRGSGFSGKKLRIAICHPDLGIGGAERLIIDAALELKNHGHDIQIFTAHHDPTRCFEETIDGTLPVLVYGDFIPRHVFGGMHALCAYIRCMYVALAIVLCHGSFDCIIADQVSAVIPVLRWKRKTKILFYCHFPDLLLAKHSSRLRSIYRAPLDWVEECTTGMADQIVVNSKFTSHIFGKTFRKLDAKGVCPTVLYPAVNIHEYDNVPHIPLRMRSLSSDSQNGSDCCLAGIQGLSFGTRIFLSINRFERKKKLELAIDAFALLCQRHRSQSPSPSLSPSGSNNTSPRSGRSGALSGSSVSGSASSNGTTSSSSNSGGGATVGNSNLHSATSFNGVSSGISNGGVNGNRSVPCGVPIESIKLVLAGGYDPRLAENREYLEELRLRAAEAGISEKVIFVPSFTAEQKTALLTACIGVVYTPENEHFGIVPLEAMAARRPVIACNSGGPKESIQQPATGFLCEPTPKSFAASMELLLRSLDRVAMMGATARRHVENSFSRKAFGDQLEGILLEMLKTKGL